MSHDNHPGQSNSQNAPATTWTEPPWSGWIETTGDALLILEAARRGLIPRVTRRLVDSERKMITSGSVFVFDEDESGIKRWTDGFFWSPSRILGNFLLYRETEKRGAGHRSTRAEREVVADPVDQGQYNSDNVKSEGQTLSRPKSEASRLGIDRHRERSLVGSLTNSYKFKPGGMMKKTFSLTIGGVAQHLISYYKVEDVEQGRLRSPSTLPELASLDISPEYLDKTHFRNPPKVEIGVDGVPRYRGEADDVDTSPQLVPAPLSSISYHDDAHPSASKQRNKRYEPYGSAAGPSTPRRPRKTRSITSVQEVTSSEAPAQSYSTPAPQSNSTYSDPSLSATTTPHYTHAPYSYYPVHTAYSVYPTYSGGLPPITTSPPLPQQSPSPTEQPQPSPPQSQPSVGYQGYPSDPPQPVYSYYPPPHGYTTYPGMWPQYSGYPPPSGNSHSNGGASGNDDSSGVHTDARGDVTRDNLPGGTGG